MLQLNNSLHGTLIQTGIESNPDLDSHISIMENPNEDPSVTRFREYLRIKSVHPNPDYDGCIAFVKRQAEEIGLEFQLLEFQPPAEFATILTWKGSEVSRKSIMLNSHMDVVPVDESKWKYDAFGAHKDEEGNIYARGSQDMKCVGVQYLEAIRRLKSRGFKPLRSIHVTFVPDEELGGNKGMKEFVKTQIFRELNVGFGLDEGGPIPFNKCITCHAERALWQFNVKVRGNTGHALNFMENTAAEKCQKILTAFLEFREKEKQKLDSPTMPINLGNLTTLNMTMIKGGLQPNVIPPEIIMTFDMRISPTWSENEAEEFISTTCKNSGDEVEVQYILKQPIIPEPPNWSETTWWTTFKSACNATGIELLPIVCPGTTDAKYLRELGIPAIGFSPMNNTPMLMHDNDEFLNEKVFLKGIEVYEEIIQKLSMMEDL